MNENLVAVYLTEEEAKHFMNFQKYRVLIHKLEMHRVFDIPCNSFKVNFDGQNKIASVEVYNRYE